MYKAREISDKTEWESFVIKYKPHSFLQSWNWGETNKLIGHNIYRIGFFKDTKLVGVCLIISESAKRGKYLQVPAGPLIDWSDKALVRLFVSTLKEYGKKDNAWFIRVRPELVASERHRKLFRKLGFIASPMHLHAENTWVLDISPSEEKILLGMRKQTRYSIKRSLNAGLTLEKTDGIKFVHLLSKLQKETSKRHGFVPFSKKLFYAQMQAFGKDGQALQFVVKKGRNILSTAIIVFYGDTAYYHFSASSTKFLKIPSSYFLQWATIKEAKQRKIAYYNFWGIAPTNNPKHRFYGVTVFKTGFGGERIDWMHAHDLKLSNCYWLTYTFEQIRKKVRRL